MKIVIMAGGQGTRFWPRSVKHKPKQFLSLTSEETMLQQSYRRFAQWVPAASIYILTTREYSAMVKEQLPHLNTSQILLEPEPRDTGPCIALAALYFMTRGDNEVMVMTPSDQYIPNDKRLWDALIEAEEVAQESNVIVTLGIVPTRPETGYGYIETEEADGKGAVLAKTFIEKPPLDKAIQLFHQKNMYWNSGIFIWKPSTIAYYMTRYQRDMWVSLQSCGGEWEKIYHRLPKISIDYAILEKASTIYTIPVHFEWDDVGSWTSLERIFEKDSKGNIIKGDVSTTHTENSIIYTENHRAVVIGIKDVIIVSTPDGLLVCHKSQEQQIKDVLKLMEY